MDHWTAKDLLAHIAAWDELFTERIELILARRADEIVSVELKTRVIAVDGLNCQDTAGELVRVAGRLLVVCASARESAHHE